MVGCMAQRPASPASSTRLVGAKRDDRLEMDDLQASDLSAKVFGNRYFAPVLVAATSVASTTGFFTVREVASAVDISDSLARVVVLRAVAAGVIVVENRNGGLRSAQFYSIASSDLANAVIGSARAVCATVAAGNEGKRSGRGGS